MQIETARNVKQEIRSYIATDVVRTRGEEVANAISIGVATTQRQNEYGIAIRARSEQHLPAEVLEEIRRKAAGEVDVRITGPVVVERPGAGTASRCLTIGCSVGHYRSTAGTLGFFARRTADGVIGVVSNNHVLAAEDRGKDDDDILHPGPADRGSRPKDVIARLAGDYPRLKKSPQTVDCAFAPLVESIAYAPLSLGGGEKLSSVTAKPGGHDSVTKLGRTTGRTVGRITAFDVDNLPVDYSFGRIQFNGLIEMESVSAQPFARPGDSGSLVLNADREPLGLLFVGSPRGGAYNAGLAYASPIDAVLETLGVTFVV
jgi:hypothetical protein